jgi:hypothetical protein
MQGKRRTVVFLSRFSGKRQRASAPVDLSREKILSRVCDYGRRDRHAPAGKVSCMVGEVSTRQQLLASQRRPGEGEVLLDTL